MDEAQEKDFIIDMSQNMGVVVVSALTIDMIGVGIASALSIPIWAGVTLTAGTALTAFLLYQYSQQ